MTTYYVRAENNSNAHAPHPGTKIDAASSEAAAIEFSTQQQLLAPGIKIYVLAEDSVEWFSTGGVSEIEAPTY